MLPDAVQEAVSYRSPCQVVEVIELCGGEIYPICPRCHLSMDRAYMRYCSYCGQALAWRRFSRAKIVHAPIRPISMP